MTGTVTGVRTSGIGARRYTIDWKCSAGGAVSANLDTDLSLGDITGMIEFIETAPGENGDLTTDLPTTLYDITLLDAHGYDWAMSTLLNRSAAVAELVQPPPSPILISQELILTIAAAGDAKRGRIIIGVVGL